MRRSLSAAALALAVVPAVASMGPASADTRNFGYRECVQGSVFLRATATGTLTLRVNRDAQNADVQTYVNGSSLITRTNYTGYSSARSAQADTNGTISSATYNCAD